MKARFAGRRFQFWLFRVSHGELLIRSPKDADHPRNVDLMFVGVEYVDLPRALPDLEVDEPADQDVEHAMARLGKSVDVKNVIVLKSQGRRYLIVAAAVKCTESDMDIFEHPFSPDW